MKTKTVSGSFSYEARGPNSNWDGWAGSAFVARAVGATVISYRKTGADYEPIDVAVTDSNGEYTIKAADPPGPEDFITVVAARLSDDGAALRFAVAMPTIADGKQDNHDFVSSTKIESLWQWGALTTDVSSTPDLLITENDGSGAMRIFDYLRYAHGMSSALTGEVGKSLVVWFRYNTSWKCGACFYDLPTAFDDFATFDSQMFIPATAEDESYWSDAVTAHELGHWVMSAYGKSPEEGGTHFFNCTTFPGQAWSEGWATGFSSLARGNSVYYDKQDGSFFWHDVAPGAAQWPTPDPKGGLLQEMSENVVSTILWQLAGKPTGADEYLSSSVFLFNALRSKRMTQAPFARGYKRHSWDLGSGCAKENVTVWNQNVPMVADFLDALACGGDVSKAYIDETFQLSNFFPELDYPYNTASVSCENLGGE